MTENKLARDEPANGDTSTNPISPNFRSLTVLVPALNEQENLGPTVERLTRALNITIEDYEIIVVNDGSTDSTRQVADHMASKDSRVKVIHNEFRRGLGHAYVQGIDKSTKRHFVYIPGDNTWPYRSFLELFGNLGKADVVTSYSTNPGVRPASRRFVSRAYTVTLNLFFNHRLHYFNGLTIYSTEFLRTRPVTTYGFGFQAEVLLKALALGLSYIEVALPIDERTAGSSKAVTLRNIVSVAATVIRSFWTIKIGRRGRVLSGKRQKFEFPELRKKALAIAITGASSGIGRDLAHALAAEGHKIFACSRREALLAGNSSQELQISFHTCDVTNEEHVQEFCREIGESSPCLDVLINCAGGFGEIGPIEVSQSEGWFATLKVNLYGPYLVTKTLLPLLKKSSSPKVINFSGGGAFNAFPNYSAYACSKAGLVRLTECMAAEFASLGISVNAVAPGILATSAHEATLRAGEEKAGALNYRRTLSMLNEGGAPMENVINCVTTLISPALRGLTGKTISANFDPWGTETFAEYVDDISRSDLYAFRRINIVNLPDGRMRTDLSEAWASFGTER